MSSDSLRKMKQQKSLKKEKITELQNGFVSNFNIPKGGSEYNALQDKYAYHYFLNHPVKKHLRKLAKVFLIINSNQAISLEPLTSQNQKVITSLSRLIDTSKPQKLSERKLKETLAASASNSVKQSTKLNQSRKNAEPEKKVAHHLYDPYIQSLKPTSIVKIRRNKLESLKKKKYIIINESVASIKASQAADESITEDPPANKRRDLSVRNNRPYNYVDKIEASNQSRHLKLLSFINKKKSELDCTNLSKQEQSCE